MPRFFQLPVLRAKRLFWASYQGTSAGRLAATGSIRDCQRAAGRRSLGRALCPAAASWRSLDPIPRLRAGWRRGWLRRRKIARWRCKRPAPKTRLAVFGRNDRLERPSSKPQSRSDGFEISSNNAIFEINKVLLQQLDPVLTAFVLKPSIINCCQQSQNEFRVRNNIFVLLHLAINPVWNKIFLLVANLNFL